MTARAMFPLGSVVVPTQPVPLQLFEPRYLALIDDVLAGDRMFGTCLIQRGSEVGGGDQRSDVGTLVHVEDAQRVDDGRWLVRGVGSSRIRITSWLPDEPYPLAEVEDFPDPEPGDAEVAQIETVRVLVRDSVTALLQRRGRRPPPGWLDAVDDDPCIASYQLVANCPIGPFDQHRLLAAPTVGLRLALLAELITDGG